jgi:CRP-like cAMP-binding protein
MSRVDTIAKLKEVPLFQNCTRRQLRHIAEMGVEVAYEKGQNVCEEGKFSDEFFVILQGRADVRQSGRKRRTLRPGDYFGEIAILRSSLIDRSPRTATVTATEPLRCFQLGRSQFSAVLYEEDAPPSER